MCSRCYIEMYIENARVVLKTVLQKTADVVGWVEESGKLG